jgi:hypothetical protein
VQIKASPQPGNRAPARLILPLALLYCLLESSCEQGAYGGSFLGSQDSDFPQEIGLNLQGDIGFHRPAPLHVQH